MCVAAIRMHFRDLRVWWSRNQYDGFLARAERASQESDLTPVSGRLSQSDLVVLDGRP